MFSGGNPFSSGEEDEYTTHSDSSTDNEVHMSDFSEDFRNDYVWDTQEDMLVWARQQGYKRNVVLVIKTSNKKMVRITCQKAGRYKSGKKKLPGEPLYVEEHRTRTRKCRCPFELLSVRSKDAEKWVLTVVHGIHNHDLSTSLIGNAYAGRLTREQVEVVRGLFARFVPPRSIVAELKSRYPGCVTSTKQVSNLMNKFYAEDRGNLTVTQWTLKFLKENGYMVHPRRIGVTNVVDILFFSHPVSLHLLKLFPYVVIIDCTYKTNRYNMSLCEIVGFTCTGKTFNIAFAFMSREEIESYTWVLGRLKNMFDVVRAKPNAIVTDREQALINAMRDVFGEEVKHLLCWVHIKHNIRAYALGVFKNQPDPKGLSNALANKCWGLFCSSTEAIYEERLFELKTTWREGLVRYVEKTWLNPYKKNIVRYWTDTILHFQTRTTNRVEGLHAVLKRNLASTRGGFNTVVLRIHHHVDDQIAKVRADMEMSRSMVPTELDGFHPQVRVLFRRLYYRVSSWCFFMLLNMYRQIERGEFEEVCTHHWWRICQGLPCIHGIAQAILTNIPIKPSDIHLFWRQVVWEGVTDKNGPKDDTIPLSIQDVRWNLMDGKYRRGEMDKDQLFQITELFVDTETLRDSTLIEPTSIVPKGRPKGSTKFGTTRDKTYLEHNIVECDKEQRRRDKENDKDQQTSEQSRGRGRSKGSNKASNKGSTVGRTGVSPNNPRRSVNWNGVHFGVENVDYFMFPYIQGAKDIEADGHCGYRALAEVLGRGQTEYQKLPWELVQELLEKRHIYEAIPHVTPFRELLSNMSYVLSPCRQEHWLEMPMVGLIFATLFQSALVLLSWSEPHTCLPMTASTGNLSPPTNIYAMALVGNKNHFIPVWLKPDAPLPPLTNVWRNYHDASVAGWDEPFRERIEEFCRLRISHDRSPNIFV